MRGTPEILVAPCAGSASVRRLKHLAGLARAAGLWLAISRAVHAREGPHAARVASDVLAAKNADREVAVTLRLEALDSAVQLEGIWAASPASVAWDEDLSAIFEATPRMVDAVVTFDGAVLQHFMLTLDFGEDGLGPVLVIPQ